MFGLKLNKIAGRNLGTQLCHGGGGGGGGFGDRAKEIPIVT